MPTTERMMWSCRYSICFRITHQRTTRSLHSSISHRKEHYNSISPGYQTPLTPWFPTLNRLPHFLTARSTTGGQRLMQARRAYRKPSVASVTATPWPPSSQLKPQTPQAKSKPLERRKAYIALGSNLGDRVKYIEEACREMTNRGIKVLRTSCLWETKPMYVLDQGEFLNGVAEVETSLRPLLLLDVLQDIEKWMGREKVIDKGPRNIDLDVLLYEGETVQHPRLTIPHASLTEREFMLRPLAELAPNAIVDPKKPWNLCSDYLPEADTSVSLPYTTPPMSTMTPMTSTSTLSALHSTRRTQIMAILNLTPDSFSDGGLHNPSNLTETLTNLLYSASIIDIGGQSTRPHAPEVTGEEELARVLPAIHAIRAHPLGSKVTISIDTYRASVARAAIAAGADIINDISAGQLDPEMLPTIASLGCTYAMMHTRGTPSTMTSLTSYPHGVVNGIASELLQRVHEAEAAGIRRWRLILDPGLGFAKTTAQNLEVLRSLEVLRDWLGLRGLPWLVGSSRKRFVGEVTGVEVAAERIWGTAATVVAAVEGGADIVRVHDAKEMRQVVKMADAIWRF